MGGPTFNLADLFEVVVDAVPDRECLVCGGRRRTYAEVDERANRLAHWFASRGLGAGDHVALCMANCSEYLEAMIAAFKIRAVPINVNYRYVAHELRYLLADADARAAVVHRSFAPTLATVVPELPLLRHVLVVEDGTDADAGGAGTALAAEDYEEALSTQPPDRDFEPRSPDDLYILYTGGTTGFPKGVMWRHEDIFFAALGGGNPGGEPATRPQDLAAWAPDTRTRSLPASPFIHGTGHWMAFAALFAGGTVVICPGPRFNPHEVWRLVAREQVTFLAIVGDAFARPLVDALRDLTEHADPPPDTSSLRVILSGGAILSPAVKATLADLLPGCLIVDAYGASETGGQGTGVIAAGSETGGSRFRLDGETALLDEELRPITEPGRVGLLARRGRVPLGYYKDPEKTAATFPVRDGVRWALPGDYAVLEDDGTVTLLGRGSVSINTGGEKVYPEEVEAALKAHAGVFDAVVVGVPDERWGERVVAVVQPRPGLRPTLEELDRLARSSLAGYKVPRGLVLVDSIRRSASGKPDYRWAREVAIQNLSSGERCSEGSSSSTSST